MPARSLLALAGLLSMLLSATAAAQSAPGFGGLAGETRDGTAPAPRSLRQVFEAFPRPCATPGCDRARVHLMDDGPEAWAARWAMLASARRSIDITYYIIADDIFGMGLLSHLLRIKQERPGVRVRLLVDAAGSPKFKLALEGGKDILQELANAGCEVKLYVPMYKGLARAAADGDVLKAIASNHDKIMVVDGVWAISGGRNVSADYYASPADHPTGFQDSDVLLHGAGPAAGLTAAFEAEWNVAANAVVHPDPGGNWVHRDERLFLYFHTMDRWLRAGEDLGGPAPALRADEGARAAAAESLYALADAEVAKDAARGLLERRSEWRVATRAAVQYKAMKHVEEMVRYPDLRGTIPYDLQGHLDGEGEVRILDRVSRMNPNPADSIAPNLMEIFDAARKEIFIANPYVVLLGNALTALARAGQNGVHTTILTNSPVSTDSLVTQAYFVQQWPQMLAAVPNLRIHVMNGRRKLHAKVASVDGVLSLVGTYNMDLISARINSEVIVAVWSPAFATAKRAAIVGDIESPGNDAQEYRIARDPAGQPLRDASGEVQVAFGPADHIDPEELSRMKRRTLELLEKATAGAQGASPLGELLPVDPARARAELQR